VNLNIALVRQKQRIIPSNPHSPNSPYVIYPSRLLVSLIVTTRVIKNTAFNSVLQARQTESTGASIMLKMKTIQQTNQYETAIPVIYIKEKRIPVMYCNLL
jgi:hypothetical protein